MNGPYQTRSTRTVRKAVNNAPKGFDIDMMEIMTTYELTLDQVRHLGKLTATRGGIAHATVGHKVYYRKRQIEELFNVKPRTDVDTVDLAKKIKDMNAEAMTEALNTMQLENELYGE
jgi:predicted phage tail protein